VKKADLQVMVIGEGGEAIVQVFGREAVLTVRQPETERLAEVRLTALQAGVLADALQRVPDEPEGFET
jgi:hypothetical protein